MKFEGTPFLFGGGVLMSKKRPLIHLNVAELVLFDDDMMYYCNFPLFNEQNSSLFIIICHEG